MNESFNFQDIISGISSRVGVFTFKHFLVGGLFFNYKKERSLKAQPFTVMSFRRSQFAKLFCPKK